MKREGKHSRKRKAGTNEWKLLACQRTSSVVTFQQSVWVGLADWKCLLGPEAGAFQTRTEPIFCAQRKAIRTV